MKETLRSIFEKVRNYFAGEPPENSLLIYEFVDIERKMRQRGCTLELAHGYTWRPGQLNNIGIVTDEKTSVYDIMHAEGNLVDVHKIVTGRDLDRNDIKRYKPGYYMEADYYPSGM